MGTNILNCYFVTFIVDVDIVLRLPLVLVLLFLRLFLVLPSVFTLLFVGIVVVSS